MQLDVGHEAECADVDAADGHGMVAVAAADAEERAVTADAQSDICPDVLDVRDAVARVLEEARLLHRHDDTHILVRIEREDALQDGRRLRLIRIRENRYR